MTVATPEQLRQLLGVMDDEPDPSPGSGGYL